MRAWPTVAVGAALLLWSVDAMAQKAPSTVRAQRNFLVKFKTLADDCTTSTLQLKKAAVSIQKQRRKRWRMVITPGPTLIGKLRANGSFNMSAKRRGVVLSVSGRIRKGAISMLVIAEHYRGRTPVCTQTWNAKGKRGKPPAPP